MSLQSELFKGDAKLEACLVHDPAHVVPGARGAHVGKIQQALIILGSAVIAPSEIQTELYGATTAKSVLDYKTRRNIINRAYQSTPDNIVGKMTIASLDRELVAQDSDSLDGIHCKLSDTAPIGSRLQLSFSVGGGTVSAPSGSGSVAAPPITAPTTPPPPRPLPPGSKSPVAHAIEVAGTARAWVSEALNWLRRVSRALKKNPNSSLPAGDQEIFAAIDVHFHLSRLPSPADHPGHVDTLVANYTNILTLLNSTTMWGDDPRLYADPNDPRFGSFATAKPGGLLDPALDKKLWFHGLFLTLTGVNARCAVMIHECGHSVATGLHFAYGHPRATGGIRGQPTANGPLHPRKYSELTPDEALHNADTYATFAAHASTTDPSPKGDFRPGAHNISS